MSDARTISIKSGLQQDARITHCNCQTAYNGSSPSQLAATIFLPGGTLQGANTYIHFHCVGSGVSNYTVEFRSLDGLTTHLSRNLTGAASTEIALAFSSNFTVPANGAWYTVYVTAPSTGDQLYIRGILFTVGGS